MGENDLMIFQQVFLFAMKDFAEPDEGDGGIVDFYIDTVSLLCYTRNDDIVSI